MQQAANIRPEPSPERKAAITNAGARDHQGRVTVAPVPGFDINRTIFQTLESPFARYFVTLTVGKEPIWDAQTSASIDAEYKEAVRDLELPPLAPELLDFLDRECDFDVEHADGSFLDHLYFCFEYTAKHYPQASPLVMFLHSILGTGTNTFAMPASKIPELENLLSAEDFKQIAAFPSVLRLMYTSDFMSELRSNIGRSIQSVHMHRVIDNAPLELNEAEFWEAMNYQLVHLVDFMPVANWTAHQNEATYIMFRDMYELMKQWRKMDAKVTYEGPARSRRVQKERLGLGGWVASKIPVELVRKMTEKSTRRFSKRCGHSLAYEIRWK